nr:vacuolar protein-sorting-associated protein 33 homolog isoform X1 [Ipomoea batatas]
MAQIPNLDNAPINLASIRDQSQKELVMILRNIRGQKCLVIDPKLSGSLSLLVQSSILKATFFISICYSLFVSHSFEAMYFLNQYKCDISVISTFNSIRER